MREEEAVRSATRECPAMNLISGVIKVLIELILYEFWNLPWLGVFVYFGWLLLLYKVRVVM